MTRSRLLLFALFLTVFCLFVFPWSPLSFSKKEKNVGKEALVTPSSDFAEEEDDDFELKNVHVQADPILPTSKDSDLPQNVDRMNRLFQPYPPVLPIVETVAFSSKTDWISGRSAYMGDYASHYKTSKHFIARSLHGVGRYLSETVSRGDRFNVFCKDKPVEFHFVADLSRLKMWAYYFDKNANERVLLKSYSICAGRLDSSRPSGSLTPLGTFSLSKEGAVYKPGVQATWKNVPKEMITIFGVRWIPFDREVANCSGSSKGLGLHGVPWVKTASGDYVEQRDSVGRYLSQGCIRLLTEDIEEIYALVTSKPSFVHVVKDFQDAKLPGVEVTK